MASFFSASTGHFGHVEVVFEGPERAARRAQLEEHFEQFRHVGSLPRTTRLVENRIRPRDRSTALVSGTQKQQLPVLLGFVKLGPQAMSEVTRVLQQLEHGDAQAAETLLPLVYDELRRLAASKMAREAPGQTLQATALVHEAWLRIAGNNTNAFEGRRHFFAAAAEAMRRILVENARRKKRLKHGGELERVDLDAVDLAVPMPDDELLALDEALERLAEINPEAAELVKLCFFIGFTQEQAAKELGVSVSTAERLWVYARAWLFRALRKGLAPAV